MTATTAVRPCFACTHLHDPQSSGSCFEATCLPECPACLISVTEAAHEFVRRTGGGYLAAEAYLPKREIADCAQCDVYAEHRHPNKVLLTQAEIDAAVTAYGQDRFEEDHDC